jgi:hypothetical protein
MEVSKAVDREELKRKLNARIDADERFAQQTAQAIETNNTSWLDKLILTVVGAVAPQVLKWVKELVQAWWKKG